jgi:Tol biopolymer transport system component
LASAAWVKSTARDTKLKRDVALKVLPEAFASDPERLARFQREAEVLASLNHPNIAQIYGVEECALAMELVEGEAPKGPMPFDEAWKTMSQIAASLEYAHDKGIIHRDLKPANIKVTPDGTVKLLDFGLAKAFTNQREPQTSTENSPTLTIAATEVGVILGTAAYMPPEQAKGKSADKRADIWSFGVVLYELLTGERAFQREDVSETLVSVIRDEPDLSKVPPKARKLLRRCLEKDPKKRLRDIGEALFLLDDAPTDTAPTRSRLAWAPWGVAAIAVVGAAALAFVQFRTKPLEWPALMRFQVLPPAETSFSNAIAISPDGRKLAFFAPAPDGRRALWIRPLDTIESRLLAGTEGFDNGEPFWSPDSRYLAFGADRKLKKIDVNGGPPQPVCDVTNVVIGGGWNREGVIIFGGTNGLWRVSAAGGTVAPLTVVDPSRNESRHLLPSFLPDGRHFIYTRVSSNLGESGIYIGSLDVQPQGQSSKRLLVSPFGVIYVPTPSAASGHVLFLRDGTLMAQPFAPDRLEFTGDSVAVAEHVGSYANFGKFGASANGVLFFGAGSAGTYQLTWYDRQGKALGTAGPPGLYGGVALSPDGARVATSLADPQTVTGDLWLIELARGISTRFTFDPVHIGNPVWSSDGRRIVFESLRGGGSGLYQKSSNGAGNEEVLFRANDPLVLDDWTRDSRFLMYSRTDPKTKSDLWVLGLEGDRKPTPYLQTAFDESQGQFSPDGRWVAYRSDESGKPEIFVQPFPLSEGGGGKFQVSNGGGAQPRWRRDGKELFYVVNDRTVMAVDVNTGPFFQAGAPHRLFDAAFHVGGAWFHWDVTADGKKFLINAVAQESAGSPLTVVLNWQAGLKQ